MPLSRRNKTWTNADDERLKDLVVASGVSALRAASIFDQSLRLIRERARRLGTPFPSVRQTRKTLANTALSAERQDQDKKPRR